MAPRKVSRRYFGDGENDSMNVYELLVETEPKEWLRTGIKIYGKTLSSAYDQALIVAEAAFDGMNFGLLHKGTAVPIEN